MKMKWFLIPISMVAAVCCVYGSALLYAYAAIDKYWAYAVKNKKTDQ